jgi:hypothetical protein
VVDDMGEEVGKLANNILEVLKLTKEKDEKIHDAIVGEIKKANKGLEGVIAIMNSVLVKMVFSKLKGVLFKGEKA